MKILIIEDEPALASSIEMYLKEEDVLVEVVGDFKQAIARSTFYDYDCILVDISLPDGSGLDVIRDLKRNQSEAGVIIISAKNSIEDKVVGLEIGADDYLAKPFHLSELNARIKALVRRKQYRGSQIIEFGKILVIPNEKLVTVNGKQLDLTRSEYRLLLYFMANPRRVLSKESIAEHVAGDEAEMLDDLSFLYSHIKNLRKKLVAAGGQDYIKAVYGMGYKMTDR